MAIELAITAETLPEGACALITSEQDRLNLFAEHMTASFPSTLTGIEVGTVAPSDFDKAWLKLDGQLRPERIYYYANGQWLSKHPTPVGTIIMWLNALPDFDTWDGGSSGAVTTTSGPMWEEATELRARIPIGVGTLPIGGAIAVAATGGAEEHTLVEAEIPQFQLKIKAIGGDGFLNGDDGTDADVSGPGVGAVAVNTRPALITEPFGAAAPTAVNLMPPYVAVYFLRKTARTFYVG